MRRQGPRPGEVSRGPARPLADEAAADAAAALAAHAEMLFGDMPDGVLIQKEGRIAYANERMARLLDVPGPEVLLGTVALELYPEASLEAALYRIQSACFGRPGPARSHQIRTAKGGLIEVEVACLLLRLGGAPVLIEIYRPLASRRRVDPSPEVA